MTQHDAKFEFFRLGIQYYISGRYALFARLVPVAASLLHHAIEMLLKGYLSSSVDLLELKGRYGHDLPKLWEEFKSQRFATSLVEFDDIISQLNPFEDLRYPDVILERAIALAISQSKTTRSIAYDETGRELPSYNIMWEEIDKLVQTIFRESSVNPAFFMGMFGESAKEYLLLNNSFPLISPS